MRKNVSTNLVVPLVVAVVISGCSLLPDSGRSSQVAANVDATPTPIPTSIVPAKPTYTVQLGEVVKQLTFSGRIAPVVEEELFFRTNGRVRSVYFTRNDLVTEGQVIADLEIEDLERELSSAQLELERAQGLLIQAEAARQSAITRARLDLEIAQLTLTRAQSQNLTPRIVQAEADLENARIARDQAQADYDAVAWRNDIGQLPQSEALQRATVEYERAKSSYDIALQEIDDYNFDLQILQRRVELAQLTVDDLESGVDPLLENDVARARLNVVKLEVAINDARVIAPFNGQLLAVSLTAGRAIEAFKPVVTIADTQSLEVSADLVSTQLQDLAEEMSVGVTLVSRPGVILSGRIRRLPYPYGSGGSGANVEELDKSTRVALDQSAADAGFELGDLVRVTVELERKNDVLWLPPQAIRVFDGRRFVVVQEGDTQRRLDVVIGIQTEERVEIEEGVTEGQTVVGP